MSDALEGLPVVEGLKVGAAGFLGGLLLMVLLLYGSGALGGSASIGPVAMGLILLILLHGWPGLLAGNVPMLLVGIFPALVLVGMGYLVARRSQNSSRRGFERGATVTAGYLLVLLVGLAYTWVRIQGALQQVPGTPLASSPMKPYLDPTALLLTVAFTGLLFPVLFGGLGGALAD